MASSSAPSVAASVPSCSPSTPVARSDSPSCSSANAASVPATYSSVSSCDTSAGRPTATASATTPPTYPCSVLVCTASVDTAGSSVEMRETVWEKSAGMVTTA